jgi:hypothetical protein
VISAFASGLMHLAEVLYANWVAFGSMPTIHAPIMVACRGGAVLLADANPRVGTLPSQNAVRWTISIVLIVAASVLADHLPGDERHGALHFSRVYFSQ